MSERTLVVISAGVGTPSSSQLLADRLAQAGRRVLATAGAPVEVRHIELRTLAADLGTALGGGAHLRNLRRTAVGSFSEAEARRLVVIGFLAEIVQKIGDPALEEYLQGRIESELSGAGS